MKKASNFWLWIGGLPLAVAFVEHYQVIGYDTDPQRVTELKSGLDLTKEFQLVDTL